MSYHLKNTWMLAIPLILATLPLELRADDTRNKRPTVDTSSSSGFPSTLDSTDGEAERVNVDKIKEKYWARGDESELGVVQNRLYSKVKKVEFSLLGGSVSSDPFLTNRLIGASIGYHFSEYLAFNLLAWKDFVSASAALLTFQQTVHATTNTNPPYTYYGSEVSGSVLYGKLSLLGRAIIYYDLNILGGLGVTSTENGNYFTPHIGIGQQIYLNKYFSIKVDYRVQHYTEEVIDKVVPLGTLNYRKDYGSRDNWSHVITLGVSFLLGKENERK